MAGELAGKFKGLIFDMDGVLYRGEQALTGATEVFGMLRSLGLHYILLTNNATQTSADFSAKLARMGISVSPGAIMTTAGATADYLKQNYPEGGGVYVLGEAGLRNSIMELEGFHIDGSQPSFVVAGLYFGFDYDALRQACAFIRAGASFIATNLDATLPREEGELWPGAGSIVAAVQTCSGKVPISIGKPNTYMGERALEQLGLQADEVLCVGDRLDTDILMGARAGMPTAMLLTGVSKREDIATAEAKPTYIFEDLPGLMAALTPQQNI